MTVELKYLLFTALLTGCLWIPVVMGFVQTRGFLKPHDYVEAPTSPLPNWVNRANRAHANAVESFAPFAAVVLIGHLANIHSSITVGAAAVFFWARVVHAVVQISGFSMFMARTIIFSIAWAAFIVFGIELIRIIP